MTFAERLKSLSIAQLDALERLIDSGGREEPTMEGEMALARRYEILLYGPDGKSEEPPFVTQPVATPSPDAFVASPPSVEASREISEADLGALIDRVEREAPPASKPRLIPGCILSRRRGPLWVGHEIGGAGWSRT